MRGCYTAGQRSRREGGIPVALGMLWMSGTKGTPQM